MLQAGAVDLVFCSMGHNGCVRSRARGVVWWVSWEEGGTDEAQAQSMMSLVLP
jgi:hypothetical protein